MALALGISFGVLCLVAVALAPLTRRHLQKQEKLIKDKYPELYFFYSDFEVTAERSDIFRYLVLDTEGGYYADMDIEPLQPLDGLLEVTKHPDCMVGLEPEVHAILAYNKVRV